MNNRALSQGRRTNSQDGRKARAPKTLRDFGERYKRTAAALGAVAALAGTQLGCDEAEEPEPVCRAELGVCLSGSAEATLNKGGHLIVGDIRLILDDTVVNLNNPAAVTRMTALSSPGCTSKETTYRTECQAVGSSISCHEERDETIYRDYEKTITSGIVPEGRETEIPVEGRIYRIIPSNLSDGSATLQVSIDCPAVRGGE